MPSRIEDYALIGDTQTAAIVGKDGSIDWLCLPRFDAPACFAALLGSPDNGRWQVAPAAVFAHGLAGAGGGTAPAGASGESGGNGAGVSVQRRYRGDSLVLETTFTTPEGVVRVVDCMPPRQDDPDVIRLVEGVSGRVPMRSELVVRFGYGRSVPWVRRIGGLVSLVAGPDALVLDTPLDCHGEGLTTVAEFSVGPGDRIPFVLEWHPSHLPWSGRRRDAAAEVADTEAWWHQWASRGTYDGGWRDPVARSLVTLKALTYAPTGGIVAAPTTSLPEQLGGIRNWDYRYCWLRDATLTLYALLSAGYSAEAVAWRDWLLRAVAGRPEEMQIMYGVAGERMMPEVLLDWLPGYEASTPVRIGNGAAHQHQLDVYGEVMDALHQARAMGIAPEEEAWEVQTALMETLESRWQDPDEGIWEVRGPRQDFTHSKVMAWVAADRAVKSIDQFGVTGPGERWAALRDAIHAEVCAEGFDAERNTFTQYYGSRELDASLLLIPQVGFLPATDERFQGTIAAIERDLSEDGFIHRYTQSDQGVDGLPPGEGAFLACTFWLADAHALSGRHEQAVAIFERLLDLRNDVGLLAEEYDPGHRRQVGNFPQAFSHVPLVNTARNLSRAGGPAQKRREA